jgi:hypothetical protein
MVRKSMVRKSMARKYTKRRKSKKYYTRKYKGGISSVRRMHKKSSNEKYGFPSESKHTVKKSSGPMGFQLERKHTVRCNRNDPDYYKCIEQKREEAPLEVHARRALAKADPERFEQLVKREEKALRIDPNSPIGPGKQARDYYFGKLN